MPTATDDTKAGVKVPQETEAKFPKIIELIRGSKSMNDEERQYWVDALPVMTQDQIESLKGILDNEKKQIEQAEKAYAEKAKEKPESELTFDEDAYKAKKKAIREAEAAHEAKEEGHEEDILKELENL